MLKIILTLIILAHGIGHILFLGPLLGTSDWGQSTVSWLLGSDVLAKLAGGLLWAAALLGFTAAGVGIAAQLDWWRTAAIIGSIVSLVGLLVFWRNPANSSAIFAGVVDLGVVFALLVARWPSVELLGA